MRTVLITGANRGLGLATGLALYEAGHTVVFAARSREKMEAALRDAGVTPGERAVVAELDVGAGASVEAFLGWLASAQAADVDVLINNAGVIAESGMGGVSDIPASVLAAAWETNVLGPYRLMQHLVPGMNARGYGRVVNVSSGMGGLTEMGGGYPAYRTSKASLNALTRIFHAEAGPNVKVNSVCPGWVRTDMGGPNAHRDIDEGIAGILWAATLPDDGPSGGFFRDGRPIAW